MRKYYTGKRVFLTGHTGFKGAWLSEMLMALGSEVYGYSLEAPTTPSLFEQLDHASRIHHEIGDVRNRTNLSESLRNADPQVIFHLAAQPLVRESYQTPVETFETNLMGTVNLLEAVRGFKKPVTVVVVTSDKCYLNRETGEPFTETDPLGGHDPYSASKAGAEIIAASYRHSFFGEKSGVRLATARAGNVIGGGDWALDRIVPDCARALAAGQPIRVRNPEATRPWQHVMDALDGYLLLAKRLDEDASLADAYNFGPESEANRPVRDLVETFLSSWAGEWVDESHGEAPHEAGLLHLSIDKARRVLGWDPVWNFERAVRETAIWYQETHQAGGAKDAVSGVTGRQIADFLNEWKVD